MIFPWIFLFHKRNDYNKLSSFNRQQTTFSFIDVQSIIQLRDIYFLISFHRDSKLGLGNKIYNFFYNYNHHLLNDLIFQSISAPETYVFTPAKVIKTHVSYWFHVSLVFNYCMYNEYSDSNIYSPQEGNVTIDFLIRSNIMFFSFWAKIP